MTHKFELGMIHASEVGNPRGGEGCMYDGEEGAVTGEVMRRTLEEILPDHLPFAYIYIEDLGPRHRGKVRCCIGRLA